jgi:hypothetical protein
MSHQHPPRWHGYYLLLLAMFTSKNQEQKAEQKTLKNLQLDQKSPCKFGANEGMFSFFFFWRH